MPPGAIVIEIEALDLRILLVAEDSGRRNLLAEGIPPTAGRISR